MEETEEKQTNPKAMKETTTKNNNCDRIFFFLIDQIKIEKIKKNKKSKSKSNKKPDRKSSFSGAVLFFNSCSPKGNNHNQTNPRRVNRLTTNSAEISGQPTASGASPKSTGSGTKSHAKRMASGKRRSEFMRTRKCDSRSDFRGRSDLS